MPQDTVEIVRKYVDAWNGAKFEPSVEDIDPAVEIDWSASNAPYGGTYSGYKGWQSLFAELRASFQDAWADTHDYVAVGPYVAVRNTVHMRGREGIEVVARSSIVFTFRDDKVIAVRLYQSHTDALAAIGAAEH